MRYRRVRVPGGTYFFTLNLLDRRSDLLVRHIEALREAVRRVQAHHPFEILAMVVLPDHLHAIWRLPEGDADYSLRWALIKAGFSRAISHAEQAGFTRKSRRQRRVWQIRYWEHLIRDENDLGRHIDYIHFNPVKHGWASKAVEWPYSSLHRYVAKGLLPADWGGEPDDVEAGERGAG